MKAGSLPLIAVVFAAAFFASLSAVAWRQGRARDVMDVRERLRIEVALEKDALGEREQQIRVLESRRQVTVKSESSLGMRMPGDAEVIHLTGGP